MPQTLQTFLRTVIAIVWKKQGSKLGRFFIEFEFSLFYEFEFKLEFSIFIVASSHLSSSPVKIYQVFLSLGKKVIIFSIYK